MGEEIAMPIILQEGRRLEYRLRRTDRRKTIALRVQRDGGVEVRAPHFVNAAHVRKFVGGRAGWIAERQRYFSEMLRQHPPKELKSGESFAIFGRDHRLRLELRPGLKTPICRLDGGRFKVAIDGKAGAASADVAWPAIREWYAALTEKKVHAVIRKHARALAVTPGELKIVEQASRWASCSKNGDIRCNWRLAMMPLPVLEHVVVHELCHLKMHDHSPRFWRMLKSVLPDYEKRRAWLRTNGPGMLTPVIVQ